MMKQFLMLTSVLFALAACSGDQPYDESANAAANIHQALSDAKTENLPVVVIFGANWCEECRALSAAIGTGKHAEKFAKEFKVVKVDVGNFNRNLDIAGLYGNPIEGGIPGATILSSDNKVIYVTKRGELSTARSVGEDGIYDFLNKHSENFKSKS